MHLLKGKEGIGIKFKKKDLDLYEDTKWKRGRTYKKEKKGESSEPFKKR